MKKWKCSWMPIIFLLLLFLKVIWLFGIGLEIKTEQIQKNYLIVLKKICKSICFQSIW